MSYDPINHISARFLREGRLREVASRNERDLLRLIWKNPGIARSALTTPLELTQQSLHRLVEKLRDRGMIVFSESDSLASGPRSPRLSPNRDWCLTVGVAVNVGSIGLCLMGFGEILDLQELPEQGTALAEDMELISVGLREMLARHGLATDAVMGVGLGVAGYRISSDSTFNTPQPLLRWSMIDVATALGTRLNLPVWAENSSKTAALAEAVFGAGRTVQDFAYIAHNYGYGGALVVGGSPFHGSCGNAGELSGLYTVEESRSRPALHLLLEHLRGLGRPDLTLTELIRNVSADWPGVLDWIERVTPAHNRAINALSSVFDPELIVLGGELPQILGRMLIERTVFNATPRHGVARRTPKLTVAGVTEAPGAIGAALLPLLATVL